jgi:hypothetical protein
VILNVYQNNKVICASKARYGAGSSHTHKRRSATHSERSGRFSRRDGAEMHIQEMSVCSNMGPIKKGDVIKIDAQYDFGKYQGMKGPNGKYTAIMGIAIMYSSADPEPWE